MASQGRTGFDFDTFQNRLGVENLNDTQKDLLEARLDLLKDFVRPPRRSTNANTSSEKPDFDKSKQGKADERKWENEEHAKRQAAIGRKGTWSFKPGSLTIVVSGPSRLTLFVQAFQWTWQIRIIVHLGLWPDHAFVRKGTLASC